LSFLASRSRKSGYALWKNISKKGPQISPLRFAPVEMTKERAVLPGTVAAEQEPFWLSGSAIFSLVIPTGEVMGQRAHPR
jgi:hypothetical protein